VGFVRRKRPICVPSLQVEELRHRPKERRFCYHTVFDTVVNVGVVAWSGELLLCNQEGSGSNPFRSTIIH
jgi:hypothetical protein